jgi:hypothetical protein
MGVPGKYRRRVNIVINNKIIEQVSSFTYLGSKISDKINADLETRLCKYNNLNGVIKRHFRNKINRDILLRLHNIVSKSTLHFGSETWILRKEDKRRLETSHMRFLRPIIGVTRRDRLTNEAIRNRLKTKDIVNDIQSYKLNWKHVDRMKENLFPKNILKSTPTGTRNIGRPRSRWKDKF